MTRAVVVLAAALLSSCAIPNVFTRFKHTTEPMTWKHAPNERIATIDVEPVVLAYVKAPAYEEIIYTRGLLDHLKQRGKSVVNVEFEAWKHFGTFGYCIVSIDGQPDRSQWSASRQWGDGGGKQHPVQALFD